MDFTGTPAMGMASAPLARDVSAMPSSRLATSASVPKSS